MSNTKDNGVDYIRLKNLRKKRGIKAAEIHKYLGVARSTYSGYETGVRVPPPDKLKKLATYLETSADYLMGFTDDESPNSVENDLYQLLSSENLYYKDHKISKELKDQLKSLVGIYYSEKKD